MERAMPCFGKLLIGSLAALCVATSPALAFRPAGWKEYVVPETGASVQVPSQIFSDDAGNPDDGYGHRFRTKDRRANLMVQSRRNADADSPSEFLKKHFGLPQSAAVYSRVGSDFFVVSGFHRSNIWYDRCNFVGLYVHCVALNYPASEKRAWDDVVTRISNTLTKSIR
jgi:hypothetical protein